MNSECESNELNGANLARTDGETFAVEHSASEVSADPSRELWAETAVASEDVANLDLANADVDRELDEMLLALQSRQPQPPSPSFAQRDALRCPELVEGSSSTSSLYHLSKCPLRGIDETDALSDIVPAITVSEPITHAQELLSELNNSRERLAAAQTELQMIQHRNQSQAERIDANTLKVQQLKSHTQQLAKQSQSQLAKAELTLAALERIQVEIVDGLTKFGGYDRLQAMSAQLETTRAALVRAHEQLTTDRELFYDSLRAIQERTAARAQAAEETLQQERKSIGKLATAIATEHQQLAETNAQLSTKLTELEYLGTQITPIHAEIVGTSASLQARIDRIERGFAELTTSLGKETEQFYALTVGAIDSADAIRTQLADIHTQIDADRQTLAEVQSAVQSLYRNVRHEIRQQATDFDRRSRELMALSETLQARQQSGAIAIKQLSTWLWILSFVVGVLLLMTFRLVLLR